LLQASILPAIVGGALFGAPGLAQLVLLERGYPDVPTSWRVIALYAEAIFHGVGAGMAAFFGLRHLRLLGRAVDEAP
jgi:hypothetical protein